MIHYVTFLRGLSWGLLLHCKPRAPEWLTIKNKRSKPTQSGAEMNTNRHRQTQSGPEIWQDEQTHSSTDRDKDAQTRNRRTAERIKTDARQDKRARCNE